MASAKLAPILADLIGSIGQDTFSHTRAVLVCKAKSHPGSKNPFTPSPSQLAIQSLFRSSAGNWKSLSEKQINDWCTLAASLSKSNKFKDYYYQAGFNLYCELQQNIQLIGGTIYNECPTVPDISFLSPINLTFDGHAPDNIWVRFPGQTSDSLTTHIIYCTSPVSAGRHYVKNLYRKIDLLPPNISEQYSIMAHYTTLFHLPTNNQKIFCKLIPVHNLTGFSKDAIITSSVFIS